jgi:hypothetical protein
MTSKMVLSRAQSGKMRVLRRSYGRLMPCQETSQHPPTAALAADQRHSQITHKRGAARITHRLHARHLIHPKMGGDGHPFRKIGSSVPLAGGNPHQRLAVAAHHLAQLGGQLRQRLAHVPAVEQQLIGAENAGGQNHRRARVISRGRTSQAVLER